MDHGFVHLKHVDIFSCSTDLLKHSYFSFSLNITIFYVVVNAHCYFSFTGINDGNTKLSLAIWYVRFVLHVWITNVNSASSTKRLPNDGQMVSLAWRFNTTWINLVAFDVWKYRPINRSSAPSAAYRAIAPPTRLLSWARALVTGPIRIFNRQTPYL